MGLVVNLAMVLYVGAFEASTWLVYVSSPVYGICFDSEEMSSERTKLKDLRVRCVFGVVVQYTHHHIPSESGWQLRGKLLQCS